MLLYLYCLCFTRWSCCTFPACCIWYGRAGGSAFNLLPWRTHWPQLYPILIYAPFPANSAPGTNPATNTHPKMLLFRLTCCNLLPKWCYFLTCCNWWQNCHYFAWLVAINATSVARSLDLCLVIWVSLFRLTSCNFNPICCSLRRLVFICDQYAILFRRLVESDASEQ